MMKSVYKVKYNFPSVYSTPKSEARGRAKELFQELGPVKAVRVLKEVALLLKKAQLEKEQLQKEKEKKEREEAHALLSKRSTT